MIKKSGLIESNSLFLVTGASGFTGGHLVRYLCSQGLRVRALVRSLEKGAELSKLGVELAIGDLENKPSLGAAATGVAGIYHIAGVFRQAALPDSAYYRVNAQGTRDLLDAAVQAGVKRFIHCSTIGVLGHVANPPADETTPYSPGDIYQESKLEGERIALEYFRSGKIGGVVIRPAMIYGPGDMRMLKLFKMIARRRFFYIGSGEAYVHFIHVRDLARAFYLAMNQSELNGEIYIICGRRALPLKQAAEKIAEMFNVPPPFLHLPVKPMQWLSSVCEAVCKPFGIEPPLFRRRVDFFTKSRFFNGAKAARDLGFEPGQDLDAELKEVIDWYVQHGMISKPCVGMKTQEKGQKEATL